MPRVNALEILTKTAAVSGIALFWVNFTVESLKLAWRIISASPEPIIIQKVSAKAAMTIFWMMG